MYLEVQKKKKKKKKDEKIYVCKIRKKKRFHLNYIISKKANRDFENSASSFFSNVVLRHIFTKIKLQI